MATSMTEDTTRRSTAAVQSPLETYLREINETSLLSADDEQELAVAIGQGDTAGPRPHGPRQPAAGGEHRPRLHRQGAWACKI